MSITIHTIRIKHQHALKNRIRYRINYITFYGLRITFDGSQQNYYCIPYAAHLIRQKAREERRGKESIQQKKKVKEIEERLKE